MKKLILLLAAFTLILASCSIPESLPATSKSEPTSTEEPTTPVVSYDELINTINQAFYDNLSAPALTLNEMATYSDMVLNKEGFLTLSKDIINSFESSANSAINTVNTKYDLALALECSLPDIPWKLTASLYQALGNDYYSTFCSSLTLEIAVKDGTAFIDISYPELRDITSELESGIPFMCTLTYAYLNTIYDENGEETEYKEYPLSESYLSSLVFPLPEKYENRLKNGWYNPRSKGTRKHTGTDLKTPADTEIYSCTAGTVIDIGSNAGAGNYVVVLDPMGYEYHYYHMIRLTDFLKPGDIVSPGQLIGHVGNTGNSDADHLHLTVVSPDYTYINPYDILKEII